MNAVICAFTNYFAGVLLQNYFTNNSGLYLALSTGAGIPGNPPVLPVEVSAVDYLRVGVTFGAPFVDRAGNMQVKNTNSVAFTVPASDWGTVVQCNVMDAIVAGDIYTYSQILQNGMVTTVDQSSGATAMVFSPGSIQVCLNALAGTNPGFPSDSADGIFNYLAEKIITDYFVNGSTYAGLLTAAATPTTNGTEVVDATYARQAITWLAAQINPFVGATSGNSGTLTFPNMTSGHTIIGTGVYSALTGPQLLAFNNVINLNGTPTPAVLTAGQGLTFSSMNGGNLNADQSSFQIGVAL